MRLGEVMDDQEYKATLYKKLAPPLGVCVCAKLYVATFSTELMS